MRVLIVARTRMGNSPNRCIGGLAAKGHSVRLLTDDGRHWPCSSRFRVGEVWDLDYTSVKDPTPPHLEDVRVHRYCFLGVRTDLRRYLTQRVSPWSGSIGSLFDGVVGFTSSGNGYVCGRLGVPKCSTGYWIPDRPLKLREDGKHFDYRQGSWDRGLSYVGEQKPPTQLAAGILVRVSLARWWRPPEADSDFEERCYLQLSGWFA